MTSDSNSNDLPMSIFSEWLWNGERGVSSEAIVSQLTGSSPRRDDRGFDHPYDPDDFRRCELMIRSVPVSRLVISRMSSRSRAWAALVPIWDDVVAAMEEEAPGCFDVPRYRGPGSPTAGRLIRNAISDKEPS